MKKTSAEIVDEINEIIRHTNETWTAADDERINAATKAAKIRDALVGRPQGIIVCPYCKKSGGNAMYRWHFDNCKLKSR